jgi:hypothetical protein
MLTSEQKGVVEKLLRVRGAAAIDVRTYVSEGNLAAATTIPCGGAPKPPPHHTAGTNGKMSNTMLECSGWITKLMA